MEAAFELLRSCARGDMKIAPGRVCRSTVEFQRSAPEFYGECYVCCFSEPSFAVSLDQNVPAAVGAKLDMMGCYLADLGARTCLIEPRSSIATQDDARDLPGCAAGIEGRHLDLNLEGWASG